MSYRAVAHRHEGQAVDRTWKEPVQNAQVALGVPRLHVLCWARAAWTLAPYSIARTIHPQSAPASARTKHLRDAMTSLVVQYLRGLIIRYSAAGVSHVSAPR